MRGPDVAWFTLAHVTDTRYIASAMRQQTDFPGRGRSVIPRSIKGHILPANHPGKPALDAIFLSRRATKNEAALRASGFTTLFKKSRSFIRVARHPSLPGYLLKVYLDSEQRQKRNRAGWEWLVRRCEGAEKIRKIIERNRIKYFQAPEKWLYRLPSQPDSTSLDQPFVLLVDDMNLVSREENLEAWKSLITREHLDELYLIITRAGGSSYRADNIWLTRHGKFAFIDTEYPAQRFDYDSISSFLSPEMRSYWVTLTQSQRKKSHGPNSSAVSHGSIGKPS
jgi:hypothetical protein